MKTPRLTDTRVEKEVQYFGLINQGATCYLNAVLQSLFMTQDFKDAVESFDKAPEDCGEDLLRHLQKLFKELSVNVATTKGITTSLGIGNVYEQQDAVEYYRKILKALGRRVSEVFEGKMNYISKCISCDNIIKKTSSFISILLPIKDENNEQQTVEKSLKAFFKRLRLDQEDWMYCDSCDQKTPTETWSEIDEYPTVLTLHLKRFAFDYNQMRYVKNACALDVPLSLDIMNTIFNLYAVINHNGGYSGGHYNALIKSDQNQKWYSFDDCTVTESETSLQGSRLPYMLMYRKAENKLKDRNPIGSNPAIHLRILLLGPPGTEKSSVGNLILGENYFPLLTIKEPMVKTVGNVTVVDTPNLFELSPMCWAKELKRCIMLSHPGPNAILWVVRLSQFSDHQQGLFHNIRKRLGSETQKHTMIIFTSGSELENLEQPIDISRYNKVKKVVRTCKNRYHVINSSNHNQASELIEQLFKMTAENRDSYCTFKPTKKSRR
ncbi:Ubiquitin carboxyl-terminal hydrolase 47 [Triplophysa tibetana]|uniref:Ubiquitin carboxyl-terminal hydrolase n=1 Tax=Triplophysa tibetana TaxID=1572043 RepID=A0A5A9PLM1_9TELE|nr:Ubiquitin carboxyl-terminal hydrolase 47 [Triplophysa tibetana]